MKRGLVTYKLEFYKMSGAKVAKYSRKKII